MGLAGKFEFSQSENFVEFLQSLGALGGTPEDAKALATAKITLEFIEEGGNKYTYVTSSQLGTRSTTFEPGKEFTEDMMGKFPVKSVAEVQGNKVTIKSKAGAVELTRVYEVFPDKLVVDLTGPQGVKAKRIYKKI